MLSDYITVALTLTGGGYYVLMDTVTEMPTRSLPVHVKVSPYGEVAVSSAVLWCFMCFMYDLNNDTEWIICFESI